MPKKKKSKDSALITPFIEGIKTFIFETFKKALQKKITQLEEMGLKIAVGSLLLVVSVFFILTGIVFVLHDWQGWSYAHGFLAIGFIAFLSAWIIYTLLEKKA